MLKSKIDKLEELKLDDLSKIQGGKRVRTDGGKGYSKDVERYDRHGNLDWVKRWP